MLKYKLMNEADPNHEIELESTNEKDATAEALEVLQWQLIATGKDESTPPVTSSVWFITIYDGQNDIDHLFIDANEELNTVIEYMLFIAYKEKRWTWAEDVQKGDDVVIDFTQGDENEVNIYCTNMIPDITITKRTNLVLNMEIGKHGMHTETREK